MLSAKDDKKKKPDDPPEDHRKTAKYRMLGDRQIINGHILKMGDVVELPLDGEGGALAHQEHGLRLERLPRNDESEVNCDVSKPYVAQAPKDVKHGKGEGDKA